MADRVILSPQARDGIKRIRAWYTQAGAGARARMRLLAILKAVQLLPDDGDIWPGDPDCPGTKLRIVAEHGVRFEPVTLINGSKGIYVHRIFGPGMLRTPC